MSAVTEYPSPSFRLVAVMALFVGIGAGAFAFFSFVLPSLSDDGKTVYIQADRSPVKVPPNQPGGMDIPHQDKLVFNEVAAPGARNTPAEHVAPPPEEPVYNGPAANNAPAIQSGEAARETVNPPPSPPAGHTDEPGNAASQNTQAPAPMPVALGRAVQPVPTPSAPTGQVVKPLETTDSFDASKVDRAMVKNMGKPQSPPKIIKVQEVLQQKQQVRVIEKPAANAPSVQVPVTQAPPPAPTPVAAAPAPQPASVQTQTAQAAEPTTTVKVLDNKMPISITPPDVPHASSNVVATKEQKQTPPLMAAVPQAPEKPVTKETQPAVYTPPSPATGAAVHYQLASYMDRASAERAVKTLSGKYGSVIGSGGLQVVSARAKGHQVYRVEGAAASKTEVDSICSRVKAAGGACVLAR